MKDLNKLRDEAYAIAKEHGWHDEEYSEAHYKCLVISELMEAVEADRNRRRADIAKFNEFISIPKTSHEAASDDEIFAYWFNCFIKDSVEDELADACIRLLDYAGLFGIDLSSVEYENRFVNSTHTLTEVAYGFSTSLDDDIDFLLGCLLGYAKNTLGIDIFRHIELKMEYNKTRPYKHGKLY